MHSNEIFSNARLHQFIRCVLPPLQVDYEQKDVHADERNTST